MANSTRLSLLLGAWLACANCSHPKPSVTSVADAVVRVSVTRIPGVAGYVHVLAANPGVQEFTWAIDYARYSDTMSGPNCEPALRSAFEKREASAEPQFIFGSLLAMQNGDWESRSLPVPEQILGRGCILDVVIDSSSGGREFAKRHIEVPLIEGFFEPEPQLLAASLAVKVKSTFVRNHGWYMVQVLAKAPTQVSLSVDWPDHADCSHATSPVAIEPLPLGSLPAQRAQRVAPGQWALASVALRTTDGGPPPEGVCNADLTITAADPNATSWSTRMSVRLSRSPSTVSSEFQWYGCPDCGRNPTP
jgi:hypothetical protein